MKTTVFTSIKDVDKDQWDRLTDFSFPFFDHDFLLALETADCLGVRSGWVPQYLVVHGDDGKLVAASPLFLKSHSFGEFIFDFSWADAYQRYGRRYYPKLVAAAPYTPATGSRLLLHPAISLDLVAPLLHQAIEDLTRETHASSVHFLFSTEAEADLLEKKGYIKRRNYQFHWQNHGYDTFEDFLQSFTAKSRAQVKKERREALASGLDFECVTGADIKESHIEACWKFYLNTHKKYESPHHLTRAFFYEAAKRMPDRLLIVLASKAGNPVAGAFNLFKGKHLYGRYWGCIEDYDFLHFEICYYRLIEFAIARRLQRFEAGAQGEHKVKRGLVPEPVFSAHKLVHEDFHRAIANYVHVEQSHVDAEMWFYQQRSPYKKGI